MKSILILTVICFSIVYSSAQYVHRYGNGHGGGHGFYGYPVGRKWGYSTYIKHPPPKHHGYGGYGHGYGQGGHGNYGDFGYGLPGLEHGGFFPNFGYGFGGPGYGGHNGHGSGFSHTYRDEYVPHSGYGYARPQRHEGYGAGPAIAYGPTGYDSYGLHKNHNYGHNYGVPSKVHNTGYIKPASDGLHGFDNFFGKYGLF